jgi:hypothetical protein
MTIAAMAGQANQAQAADGLPTYARMLAAYQEY